MVDTKKLRDTASLLTSSKNTEFAQETGALLKEAADEIERLQKDIDCGGGPAGCLNTRRVCRSCLIQAHEAKADEIERLRNALTAWEMDPHHYSKRPCGTCQQISDASGKPFGCIRYALTGEPYIKAAAEAAGEK